MAYILDFLGQHIPTGYATRYEQANRKGEGCPFDPLSGRRERRKKRNEDRAPLAKSVLSWKKRGENG
jgi:hypothetical protein